MALTSLRKILEKVVVRSVGSIPAGVLRKVTNARILIPYYHVVSERELSHVRHLYKYKNERMFREDLDFLGRKYAPITLRDLLDSLYRERKLPKNAMLLTFDDGFREMHDVVAPILLEKGIPATFFVNTDFLDNREMCYLNKASVLVDVLEKIDDPGLSEKILRLLPPDGSRDADVIVRLLAIPYEKRDALDEIAGVLRVDFAAYLEHHRPYLASGQIKEMIDRGFTFGAHSLDHPVYSALPEKEQVRQTLESLGELKRRFSISYGAFAFPRHDRNVARLFFDEIFKGGADVTFGSEGFLDDGVPRHFQRVNLERTLMPADYIIAKKHAQKIRFTIAGKANIRRA